MKIWFSQDFRVTSPSFLEALRFENDSFQQIAFAKNLRRKNQNFHRNYVHLCDNLPVDVRPDCVQLSNMRRAYTITCTIFPLLVWFF